MIEINWEDFKFFKEVEKIHIEIKCKDEKDTTIFTADNNNTKDSKIDLLLQTKQHKK